MDIYIIFIIADNQICQALGGYLHNFDYNQIWRALGGYLIFLLLRIIIFIIIADKQICRALGGYLSKFLQRILEALRQRPHQVFVFDDDDDHDDDDDDDHDGCSPFYLRPFYLLFLLPTSSR